MAVVAIFKTVKRPLLGATIIERIPTIFDTKTEKEFPEPVIH